MIAFNPTFLTDKNCGEFTGGPDGPVPVGTDIAVIASTIFPISSNIPNIISSN